MVMVRCVRTRLDEQIQNVPGALAQVSNISFVVIPRIKPAAIYRLFLGVQAAAILLTA